MPGISIPWFCLLAATILLPAQFALRADDPEFSAADIEFFESEIRPILVDHCLECHGAAKAEHGLRLDSRVAILTGGESKHPGAIAGDPDHSLILQSIRHQSDYEMPPDGKLDVEQIALIAKWIELGLPWPENNIPIAKTLMGELIELHRKTHWSFQPVRRPEFPPVQKTEQTESPIDQLVLSKLLQQGLDFSPRADRRTLIRRATFDLTGLPPTFEQVDAFVNDSSPDAYQNLIDRLLDSPQYGERWARHWLDVARYSDTRGYTFDNADRNYPFAFTYRDYVVDALNADLPYDQFIREQLAADYLDVPEHNSTLAALGFIMVGRKFIARPDTVDDQIDVVTRGLMGLTVSCARCHDHKFDAIPTEDYYSLYGVFENCHEPDELPLIGDSKQRESFQDFFDELEKRKQAVVAFEDQYHQKLQAQVLDHLPDYLTRVIAPDSEEDIKRIPSIRLNKEQLNEVAIAKWRSYLVKRAKPENPTLMPMGALFALPDEGFADSAKKLIETWHASDEVQINPLVLKALKISPPESKAEIGLVYGNLFNQVVLRWKQNGSKQPALAEFTGPEKEIAKVVFEPNSPAQIKRRKIEEYFNVADNKEWAQLKSNIDQHNATAPDGLRRAMAIRENNPPHNEQVMIRGDMDRRGDEVPRQFVALLSEADRSPFQNRAGRLELADKIADRENPLTARVLVNRVWMHHFSKPLVDTPSDFGIRCPAPVQQALLDYLAWDFMENGWSIKHLHRTIMMSYVYRQASQDRASCSKLDPENSLLWKMNRRRLEFEALRDSMLAVAGNLDPQMHGKSVNLFQAPWSNRRTIYGKIDRQDLPNLLRIFDLANPDQSTAKRIRTTVPQQPLFMLNNGFAIEQARRLANVVNDVEQVSELEPDRAALLTQTLRIQKLYQTVFQRDPTEKELEIATSFLQSAAQKEGQLSPWEQFAQILLCTNEFEFVD